MKIIAHAQVELAEAGLEWLVTFWIRARVNVATVDLSLLLLI